MFAFNHFNFNVTDLVLSLIHISSNSDSSASDSSDSSSTATGAAFKLGGTAPLTGGAAIYGNAVKNGAQIAVDEINAEGGAIQFELKYEDDQHDAEKAVNAYNALKDWGMQISLGSVTTKPCEATSVLNNEDRIFGLTPSASSEATTDGKDDMFQMCFTDPNQEMCIRDSPYPPQPWPDGIRTHPDHTSVDDPAALSLIHICAGVVCGPCVRLCGQCGHCADAGATGEIFSFLAMAIPTGASISTCLLYTSCASACSPVRRWAAT